MVDSGAGVDDQLVEVRVGMADPDGCSQAADVDGGTVRVGLDRVDPVGARDGDGIGRAVSDRAAERRREIDVDALRSVPLTSSTVIASVPPRALTSIASMPSRSMTIPPRFRVNAPGRRLPSRS